IYTLSLHGALPICKLVTTPGVFTVTSDAWISRPCFLGRPDSNVLAVKVVLVVVCGFGNRVTSRSFSALVVELTLFNVFVADKRCDGLWGVLSGNHCTRTVVDDTTEAGSDILKQGECVFLVGDLSVEGEATTLATVTIINTHKCTSRWVDCVTILSDSVERALFEVTFQNTHTVK